MATGGSQCGFCTPGIVMRLAALAPAPADRRRSPTTRSTRPCWPTCAGAPDGRPSRRPPAWSSTPTTASGRPSAPATSDRAAARATHRRRGAPGGRAPPSSWAGPGSPTTPARPAPWWRCPTAGAATRWPSRSAEARALAGKVQGRSTSLPLGHPVDVPPGDWDLTLQTTWVEPGYVEPDASWCVPGGEPASPYGNGGAFGGKLHSPVAADARRLADEHGRPVRVLWSREDVVRHGPKRPPVAGGIDRRRDRGPPGGGPPGRGRPRRSGRPSVAAVATVAPGLVLEPVPLAGPPVSFDLRGAVWAEAAVLAACARSLGALGPAVPPGRPGRGHRPGRRPGGGPLPAGRLDRGGGRRRRGPRRGGAALVLHRRRPPGARLGPLRGHRRGRRRGGPRPDHAVVRDPPGPGHAPGRRDHRAGTARPPVNGSDAVFAAVAAARWLADGLPIVAHRPWPDPADADGGTVAGACPRRLTARRTARPSKERPMSTPIGPYTPIVRAGPWLICSGQLGLAPLGRTASRPPWWTGARRPS